MLSIQYINELNLFIYRVSSIVPDCGCKSKKSFLNHQIFFEKNFFLFFDLLELYSQIEDFDSYIMCLNFFSQTRYYSLFASAKIDPFFTNFQTYFHLFCKVFFSSLGLWMLCYCYFFHLVLNGYYLNKLYQGFFNNWDKTYVLRSA